MSQRVPAPIFTQTGALNSIDSGVAMTDPDGELDAYEEPDHVSKDDTLPVSDQDKMVKEVREVSVGFTHESSRAEAQGAVKTQPPTTSKGEDLSLSDLSSFMKTAQRILKSSSTKITLRIEDRSDDSSSDDEDNNDVDTKKAAGEDSGDSKLPFLKSITIGSNSGKEHEPGSCQCTACINEKKQPATRIAHAVEYTDNEDDFLRTEDRDKPLDLSTERKEVNAKRISAIITVATVVKTSVSKNYQLFNPMEWKEMVKKSLLSNKDVDANFQTLKLFVESPAIIQALRSVVKYYPNLGLRSLDRIPFTSPFSALAHHMDVLRDYRDNLLTAKDQQEYPSYDQGHKKGQIPAFPPDHQESPTFCNAKAAEHITVLLDYLKEAYGDRVQAELARNERDLCTFSMLWAILVPGTTVYVRDRTEDLPSAMVIKSVEVDPTILFRNDNERSPYKIHLWGLDYDGRSVGRTLRERTLAQFDGECSIFSLQVFPCRFLDRKDDGETRRKIIERGKKWYGLLKGDMVRYDGKFVGDRLAKAFTGRVYVDPTSYWRSGTEESPPTLGEVDNDASNIGGCTCSVCTSKRSEAQKTRLYVWKNYDNIDSYDTKSLELDDADIDAKLGVDKDHRYLICSPVLGGLVLKTRSWKNMDIAHCSKVEPRDKAIDNLVLLKSRKDMIKALLHNYSPAGSGNSRDIPTTWNADFIEDKGDGRIFLLHGPPGVGKTYTAECIAEYTGRPLISLTCGDIGIREETVEKHLQTWFALGEKWGAVMLIDEADVYLETRKPGDLKRNGLVSVFLRAVEYYKGILFLTTNRVGQFDDAFMSRIHVILRYDMLSLEDRKKIWEGFFDKLERERGRQLRITKRARQYVLEDEKMKRIPWNGREIRNAFQTAVALAQYQFAVLENKEEGDKAELDKEHFEDVCAMATNFKDYLRSVHREDEEARRMRRRDGL